MGQISVSTIKPGQDNGGLIRDNRVSFFFQGSSSPISAMAISSKQGIACILTGSLESCGLIREEVVGRYGEGILGDHEVEFSLFF